MNSVDFIIVGQGIAGSVLSLMLQKVGYKVVVIDDAPTSSASLIAAGIYNPIVFKRLVKSWRADELISFAEDFYNETERLFGSNFLEKKSIVKVFAEQQEVDFWEKKVLEKELINYLNTPSIQLHQSLVSPFGTASVNKGGVLNVAKFIHCTREHLKKLEAFLQEQFDFDALFISEQKVSYKTISAKKIIFCEGHKVTQNPFFNWLPFKLAKGELLTIKASGLNLTDIVNKGVFILPISNDIYKVGATYEWDDLNEISTEMARLELTKKLDKVITAPYEIISQNVGIRPAVIDRRPILGFHPIENKVAIFNGMGTKGIMIAPLMADFFSTFIQDGKALDKEISIDRFLKFFKKSPAKYK